MNYTQFLETKEKKVIESGFEVENLNDNLFQFQDFIVKKALKKGKYAIFADTGLGKTIMQLSWANQVVRQTKKPVLILAPLAVSYQTIEEGEKFGIKVWKYQGDLMLDYKEHEYLQRIVITNYEQLNNIDCSQFAGIVLDESSILKNETGKYRNLIIDKFKETPYKLCCTATPSPNDPMELGNHAEFLDVMGYSEMLAMYFVHDSAETQKWRLKGHAIDKFYEFVSTWSIMLNKPSDIGFKDKGYDLPDLILNDVCVKTKTPDGMLFGGLAVNATDFNKSLRETEILRVKEVIKILENVKSNQVIIWCHQNKESDLIYSELKEKYNCRNVKGSDKSEKKEKDLIDFAHNQYQILITKPKIAQFGMNYQNCHYQIFASVDFSFESTYQSIRRSWRFGQKHKVNIYLITTDRMINISKTQKQKQKQFKTMQEQMTKAVNKNLSGNITSSLNESDEVKTDNYWLMKGDCVQKIKKVKTNEVDLIIFSPPFADLYTYSKYIEDMGNVSGYKEFEEHFKFLVPELKRIIKPGRIIAIHCMDLPTLKSKDGYIGIKRFSSLIGDMFEKEDMFLHSEFTIWKDPLLAAVRTKTIGLAHKQLLKDSSIVRAGLPDKVLCFKTKEENTIPINHDIFDSYIPMHKYDNFPKSVHEFKRIPNLHNPESEYSIEEQYSHLVWQRYASPVWMDIDQTNTLQWSKARDKNDEKHICPLQLDVIERLILLYSNKGETIFSPFGGIGSEGYQAIKMERKSISIELKDSYFKLNKRNHISALENKSQLKIW